VGAVLKYRFIKGSVAAWLVLYVLVLVSTQAHAQTIPPQDLPSIQRQQDDIQRRHADEVKRREAERRRFQDTPPDGYVPPQVETPILEDGACMDIGAFDVQGAKLIPGEVLNIITAEFIGKCLTLEQINALLAEISNWYLDRGYVTTRAYLPPQDLTTGTLQIVVVEGRAEDIRFSPEQEERNRLRTAFPGVQGEVLNIRDLEQGLDQLNRLPSNNAKLKLEPGAETGDTLVLIENQQAKRLRLSLSEDNSGSRSTGVRQRTVEISADDVFGVGDIWSLTHKPSLTDIGVRGSKMLSGSMSVPYGYWTIGYAQSWFTYVSTIQATTKSYTSRGSSRQHDLTVERVVHRDADSKTSIEGALTLKQARNFVAETLLETQSRKLSVAGLTMRHSTKFMGGSLSATATAKQGLRAFGAKKDHAVSGNTPRAQFRNYSADLSYSRPFQVQEQNLNASLALHGVWSPHTLFGSERLGIGGLSTVRGFKEESASGDVGGYARSQLSWTMPATGIKRIDQAFGRFVPYAALDGGWIKSDPAEETEGGTLTGWALGLRTSGGIVTFAIAWAQPIAQPRYFTKRNRALYSSVDFSF